MENFSEFSGQSSPNSSAVSEFYRKGYTRIKGLFNSAQVADILAAYSDFLKYDAPNLDGRDINFADAEKGIVNSIHALHYRPETYFSKLLNSDRLRQVAGAFLKDEAIGRASEMFAKPPAKGLPSPAHQDNYYWCLKPVAPGTALTIWVALDHCGFENGGVCYLENSHEIGLIEHEDSFAPGSSQTIRERQKYLETFETVCLELEPGDALVHDAMTVHFSAANTSARSRRGMTLQYTAKRAEVDQEMKRHYETRLLEQVQARALATQNNPSPTV